LANLLQSSRSTLSRGSFLSFFAFKEGILDTQISALGGWPTVSGGFSRQVGRLRSCRRPPLLLLGDKKDPNYRNNNRLKGLGNYSEWPKVADAVIKAGNWLSYKQAQESLATASRSQGWTCGKATPHRGQACAPGGGNGLPQPGQCVANRVPQWAQNCQCEAISRRQSWHSWRNW
jgi:hypothetical protein